MIKNRGKAQGAALVAYFAFGVASAVAGEPSDKPSTPTVVHASHVFDGERLLADRYVFIQDGRITKVSSQAPTSVDRATVLELGHATLLPGLIDVHAHLLLQGDEDLDHSRIGQLTRSSARKALTGLANAQTLLSAGFTAIRDPGDIDAHVAHLEVRDAINSGLFTGPDIVAAGRFITRSGGHYDDNWLAEGSRAGGFARIADGAGECVRAVRAEVKSGADWIKIAASGGYATPRSLPQVATFTDEELQALVKEAHRLNKRVAAHAIGEAGINSAIRAGVDSIEHGISLSAAQMVAMAKRGIYWVPTWYAPVRDTAKDAWLTAWRSGCAHADCAQQLREAAAAGLSIAFGTDSGTFPHGDGVRLLAMFVEAGMRPVEAIRTATTTAAKMLGFDDMGRIAPGQRANLIAVVNNPLEDIRTLESVRFVMIHGRVVRNELDATR